MKRIAELLRSEKGFTVRQVAAEFEVTRKTIHRDIEFMRDRLGYVIEFTYDGGHPGVFVGYAPRERIL